MRDVEVARLSRAVSGMPIASRCGATTLGDVLRNLKIEAK